MQILDATRIEDVVGDFVTLKRAGSGLVACCPFHNEKTPSFHVTPSRGIYKCFGCGKGGDAVSFLMEHEHCSYPDALRYLARKYHIEIVEEELSAEEIQRRQKHESLLLITEFAHKFFVEQLKTPEGQAVAMAYYRSRGLEGATVEKFGLGWAPSGRRTLTDAALAAGYKEEFLLATGLSLQKEDGSLVDRFRERVMFPIHNIAGRVIAFSGRTLKTDNMAKYVNSPESEIYIKSRALLGIYHARTEIAKQDKCYLVEGNVDVITMQQLGVTNVVASCGTSLTVEQIRLISRFTKNLTIMYDGDKAGIKAAIRGIDMVLAEGMNVRIALLPEGEDPDSFGRSHTLQQVQEYIAAHETDFVSFKTDLALEEAQEDPYRKSALINDIADSIARIPDPVQRSVYGEATARRFDMESSIIFGRINRTLKELKDAEIKARTREENLRQRSQSQPGYQTLGPADAPAAEVIVADPVDVVGIENRTVARAERDLLYFILKYGDELMEFPTDHEFYAGEENKQTVRDFIRAAMDEAFVNSAYRMVYDAYMEAYDAGLSQDMIIRNLLASENRMVSQTVSSLYIDKYELTVKDLASSLTATSSWLVMYVPKTIIYYAERRIQSMLDDIKKQLSTASDEEQPTLMGNFIQLQKAQKSIKKKLQ